MITSYSAQIKVQDSKHSCGANVDRRIGGYVADLHFWGDAIFVARRKGSSGLHLMIAPSDAWRGDIETEEFVIVGKFSEIVKAFEQK